MNWAVILAGGNGSRLRSLTRVMTGDDRPKQFCPLVGEKTLLAHTRARLALNVPVSRTLCVVTRDHEAYYRSELSGMPDSQIVEQPCNRGTAPAIAYGIARVACRDDEAVVGLYPADHYYEDHETFRRTVDATYAAAWRHPARVFLLAAEPDSPEVEYGWIEPGLPLEGPGGRLFAVSRFWEKPSQALAGELLARRCLWNMFVMIGSPAAFRALFHSSIATMARALELAAALPAVERDLVEQIYDAFPPSDFSKDVLTEHPHNVAVVRAPGVGWTDLGQPARVRRFLRAHRALPPVANLSVAS